MHIAAVATCLSCMHARSSCRKFLNACVVFLLCFNLAAPLLFAFVCFFVFLIVQVQNAVATVSGLQQGYVICPAEQRFLLLFTFLKKNKDKKVMVFFSSCMSVRFHDELFNYIDLPTTCIHGKKKQAARMSTYYEFCEAEVCSRG